MDFIIRDNTMKVTIWLSVAQWGKCPTVISTERSDWRNLSINFSFLRARTARPYKYQPYSTKKNDYLERQSNEEPTPKLPNVLFCQLEIPSVASHYMGWWQNIIAQIKTYVNIFHCLIFYKTANSALRCRHWVLVTMLFRHNIPLF